MGDDQQASFATGVRDVRVGGRGGELSDDQITGRFGVVHEEAAVRCVVRVKRNAEQTALAARAHAVVDIQERLRQRFARLDDLDGPVLLDDEQAVDVMRGRGQMDRQREAFGDQFGGQGRAGDCGDPLTRRP